MIDSDVQKAIKSALDAGLAAQGYPNITVKQNYQPTTQGAPSTPTVFFTKISAERVGHQGRKQEYNAGNGNFDVVENYWLAPTYQITALIKQDITDENSASAFDIVDLCAAILMTAETRRKLLATGIGIQNIGPIRDPKFLDDADEFENQPSFDVVLTYNQTINNTVPVAHPIELDIRRV